MIELYLSKNNNHSSEAYGKYYPRVSYKETLDIHLMAKHMAEHNTPFSEGTIEGILRDFVKCTREQTLMGNTVKVDDLAIFKVSVIGNGCAKLYDKDSDKTISASLGSLYNPKTHQNDLTGPAVASLKLLAQATGEYTREELNKVAKLGWTDAAAQQIAAAKAAELGDGTLRAAAALVAEASLVALFDRLRDRWWQQHAVWWWVATTRAVIRRIPVTGMDLIRIKTEKAINFRGARAPALP